jgi:hypothetical protein
VIFKLYENGDITYSNGIGNSKIGEMSKNGKINAKKKKYCIDSTSYREIVSAAIKLVRNKKNEVIFLTYTFQFSESEIVHQTIFKNHLKNFSTNYGLEQYIWTKERQKRGAIHFHLLADFPFMPINDINSSFNSSISNYNSNLPISNNSVRLPKDKSIVENVGSAARYLAKYISKQSNIKWELPCYAISKGLYPLFERIDTNQAMQLQREFLNFIQYAGDDFGVISLRGYI